MYLNLAIRNLCFIFFLLFSFSAVAQSTVLNKDSLLQVIPTVKSGPERIRVLYQIMEDSGNKDPKKALSYYTDLLEITRQLKDKEAEAVVTAELGYATAFTGNTTVGTDLLFNALRLAEEAGSQQAIGIAYDNLGVVYADPVKSKDYLFKALTASTAANDYVFMCWELGNLAGLYLGQGQIDSALYYNQRAMELATIQKLAPAIAIAQIMAGKIHYLKGQKGLALEYYRAALRDPYTVQDAKAKGFAYGVLTDFFRKEGQTDSALHYAHLHQHAVKDAFYAIQSPAAFMLWKVYEPINADSALKYVKQYYAMQDSMFSMGQLQLMESQALLEAGRQQKLAEERKHNLQYAAIAFGVLTLLIGFFVFSHSVIANQKVIKYLGMLSLLILFEFINLLIHPFIGNLTHHSPVWMLSIMVCIAALLIPLHHKMEHWITHKLVEKNKAIRLAAARKTIEKLESV